MARYSTGQNHVSLYLIYLYLICHTEHTKHCISGFPIMYITMSIKVIIKTSVTGSNRHLCMNIPTIFTLKSYRVKILFAWNRGSAWARYGDPVIIRIKFFWITMSLYRFCLVSITPDIVAVNKVWICKCIIKSCKTRFSKYLTGL